MVDPSTMRPWVYAAILSWTLLVGGHGLAQSPPEADPLATAAAAALSSVAPPDGATISALVIEAATGRVRFARDPDRALNPASNTKLLTAAAALSLLGPSARFTTTVRGPAPDTQGRVAGDIVLVGGGDPSLSSGDLYTLAQELRARGVRRVDGDLLGDDSLYGDEHLPPAFEQQPQESAAFRAAVSALTVDENAASLTVTPDLEGAPALLTLRPVGYFDLTGSVTTTANSSGNVRWRRQPLRDARESADVSGSVAPGALPLVLRQRLDNPTRAAVWSFRQALTAAGISVRGRVREGVATQAAVVLALRRSEPLSVLMHRVGRDSNNLYAEMLLLGLGATANAPQAPSPTTSRFAQGATRVQAWLRDRGIDTAGLVLRNGSGLFDANRVTVRQLVGTLRAAWRDPGTHAEYLAQLAVGGEEGTLRSRLATPDRPRIVRAKTGTLREVVALSGFVLSDDPGQCLIFAYIANGLDGQTQPAQRQADAFVQALARGAR